MATSGSFTHLARTGLFLTALVAVSGPLTASSLCSRGWAAEPHSSERPATKPPIGVPVFPARPDATPEAEPPPAARPDALDGPAGQGAKSTWLEAQDSSGSTRASEQAVDLGLQWLAEHQFGNGGWSFDHRLGSCQGRCGDPGGTVKAINGATGLALLPFICHGNTHASGPYRENVKAGLRFLILRIGGDGSFWEPDGRMYSHALAWWALCEDCRILRETPGLVAEGSTSANKMPQASPAPGTLAGATTPSRTALPRTNRKPRGSPASPPPAPPDAALAPVDPDPAATALIRAAAATAQAFTVAAQDPRRGGWRYQPRTDSDISVTGWQVVAFHSATQAGFDAPPATVMGVSGYLNSLQSAYGATYGYTSAADASPTRSSIGLLCRIYTGCEREHPALQAGVKLLAQYGPSETDMYYNYYATMVLHHVGGPLWEDWNRKLREYLIRTQSRFGHETGSWHFAGPHAGSGGRLYNTALALLILETYYRAPSVYKSPGDEANRAEDKPNAEEPQEKP